MKLPFMDTLGSVGLVGERKATALLCLGFYTTLFFMIGLSARTELPEWVPVFSAMTLMYAPGVLQRRRRMVLGALVRHRPRLLGPDHDGDGVGDQTSLPPAMIIFGGMHGIVSLCLGGEKMAALFDAQPAWRQRWKVDEQGVIRVRKSVTRARPCRCRRSSCSPWRRARGRWRSVSDRVRPGARWRRRRPGPAARLWRPRLRRQRRGDGWRLRSSAAHPRERLRVLQPDASSSAASTGAPLTPMLGVAGAGAAPRRAALPFARPMAAYVLRRR